MTSNVFNGVGWFEIPVTNMERAITFYEEIFHIKFSRHDMGPLDMAWFPWTEGQSKGAAGALVKHPEWYKPTLDGPLLYFTTPTGDIDEDLQRIEKAGGTIYVPKKEHR